MYKQSIFTYWWWKKNDNLRKRKEKCRNRTTHNQRESPHQSQFLNLMWNLKWDVLTRFGLKVLKCAHTKKNSCIENTYSNCHMWKSQSTKKVFPLNQIQETWRSQLLRRGSRSKVSAVVKHKKNMFLSFSVAARSQHNNTCHDPFFF